MCKPCKNMLTKSYVKSCWVLRESHFYAMVRHVKWRAWSPVGDLATGVCMTCTPWAPCCTASTSQQLTPRAAWCYRRPQGWAPSGWTLRWRSITSGTGMGRRTTAWSWKARFFWVESGRRRSKTEALAGPLALLVIHCSGNSNCNY